MSDWNEYGVECPRCANEIRFEIYFAETNMYILKFNSEGRLVPLARDSDPENSSRDMVVCIRCPFCGFRAPPNFFGWSEAGLEVQILSDNRGHLLRESRLGFRNIPFSALRVYFDNSEQAEAALKLAKRRKEEWNFVYGTTRAPFG